MEAGERKLSNTRKVNSDGGQSSFGNAKAGNKQGCKQLAPVLSNPSADSSIQTSELLRMGRTSQDRLVQPLCRPHSTLALSSHQNKNHHFDLLAKCSFSHFQLFLLHLVLLKSPTNNQISALAPPSPRSTLPAPAATIMTFFLLELIMLPTNCNSLAAVLSLFW